MVVAFPTAHLRGRRSCCRMTRLARSTVMINHAPHHLSLDLGNLLAACGEEVGAWAPSLWQAISTEIEPEECDIYRFVSA